MTKWRECEVFLALRHLRGRKNNDYWDKILGPLSLLDMENKEKQNSKNYKSILVSRFSINIINVRFMTFNLAENLGINHKFNKEIGSPKNMIG